MVENEIKRKLPVSIFAEMLNISRSSIYRYIKTGVVVPRRSLGNKPFFYYEDLEKYRELENTDLEYTPTGGMFGGSNG